MRITAAATLVALLACPTARADDAPVPAGKARLKMPSGFGIGNPAFAAINGQPYDGSNPLILDPGHYTFTAQCVQPADLTPAGLIGMQFDPPKVQDRDFSMDLQAGHEYRYNFDDPDSRADLCGPYFYDSTGGRDVDSESLQVAPVAGSYGKWHKFASMEHAGHFAHDSLPMDQYRQQLAHIGTLSPEAAHQRTGWQQMFETESWVRLTYPYKALDFYQKQITDVKHGCPSVQVTVLSQADGDILYDLEFGPDCVSYGVRSMIGRFVDGAYDVHHAAIYSRTPLQDADKTAWISALKSATVTEDN